MVSTPADGSLHHRKATLGLVFCFFFFPLLQLLAVIGFRLKQTTSPPGKEGIGAGAEERLREKGGTKGESREGFQPSSQTKQKKDQKTRKRRANGYFQEQSPHLLAAVIQGSKVSACGRQRRRGSSGYPRAWARCGARSVRPPRKLGPCLPPREPPAASCSPCSRSVPLSPPSARPKAATSAPK